MSENWVDGSLESGADGDDSKLERPGPESGAELGLTEGDPNSFEPEEAAPGVTPDSNNDGPAER